MLNGAVRAGQAPVRGGQGAAIRVDALRAGTACGETSAGSGHPEDEALSGRAAAERRMLESSKGFVGSSVTAPEERAGEAEELPLAEREVGTAFGHREPKRVPVGKCGVPQ